MMAIYVQVPVPVQVTCDMIQQLKKHAKVGKRNNKYLVQTCLKHSCKMLLIHITPMQNTSNTLNS